MSRYIWIILLVLLSSCMANAADIMESSSNINTSVTVAVKGYSLVELASLLQNQTGIQFRVDRDIADNKVTVFVDDKPLIQVMNGLETLFQYKWYRKDFNGKRVYQFSNPSRANKRTSYGESVSELWKRLDKELARVSESVNNQGYDLQSRQAYETAVIASFIREFPATLQEAFLNEYTIYFHTASPEPEWVLPTDVALPIPSASGGIKRSMQRRIEPGGIVITTATSTITMGLSISSRLVFDNTGIDISGSGDLMMYSTALENKVVPVLENSVVPVDPPRSVYAGIDIFPQSVHIDCRTPDNHLPKTEASYFADKITLTPQDISKESGLQPESKGVPANRSDILALLHKKANIQIIADHYSQWDIWNTQSNVTVNEVIGKICKESPISSFSGCDENYLYIRNMYPVKSGSMETPNQVLRPLQEVSKEMISLDLDQIADMSALGDDKFLPLQKKAKYLKLSFQPEQMTFIKAQSRTALDIYGILSPKQRQDAFNRWINISMLTQDQRTKLTRLIVSGNNDDPSLIKVGIYKDNIRIDKKQPSPEINITSLKMVKGFEADAACLPTVNIMPVKQPGSPDRAAKVYGYTLILRYADGKVDKIAIPLVRVQ
ncbi:MAG: hypothetical protein ACYC27_22830 [Armatimonadota bacterium]